MEMQIGMVVADAVMMATIRKVILKGMFVTVATIKMVYTYEHTILAGVRRQRG